MFLLLSIIGNKRVYIGDFFSIWYIVIFIEEYIFGSFFYLI